MVDQGGPHTFSHIVYKNKHRKIKRSHGNPVCGLCISSLITLSCTVGPSKKVFVPASDAANIFKRRGRRSPKLYTEYVGEFHCHPAFLR